MEKRKFFNAKVFNDKGQEVTTFRFRLKSPKGIKANLLQRFNNQFNIAFRTRVIQEEKWQHIQLLNNENKIINEWDILLIPNREIKFIEKENNVSPKIYYKNLKTDVKNIGMKTTKIVIVDFGYNNDYALSMAYKRINNKMSVLPSYSLGRAKVQSKILFLNKVGEHNNKFRKKVRIFLEKENIIKK